jgi:replication factor C subunit 1
MDEVDGVGAGDRGGVAALIQIIKNSKTPIICICNDRQNQKLASLVNHCLDLKFMKPTNPMVLKRMEYICNSENLNMPKEQLLQIIESSG